MGTYTEITFGDFATNMVANIVFDVVVGKITMAIAAFYKLDKIVTTIEAIDKIYTSFNSVYEINEMFVSGSDQMINSYIKTVTWFASDGFHVQQEYWYPYGGPTGKERYEQGIKADIVTSDVYT